jgi:hypothetical protein
MSETKVVIGNPSQTLYPSRKRKRNFPVPIYHLYSIPCRHLLAVCLSSVGALTSRNPIFLFIFYYYLVCEAIGTATTPGLFCQPRVIVKMILRKQMECRLAGENEVLGENLPQLHFCPSQNPT